MSQTEAINIDPQKYFDELIAQTQDLYLQQSPNVQRAVPESAAIIAELSGENEIAQYLRGFKLSTPQEILSKARFGEELAGARSTARDKLAIWNQVKDELEKEKERLVHLVEFERLWDSNQRARARNYYNEKINQNVNVLASTARDVKEEVPLLKEKIKRLEADEETAKENYRKKAGLIKKKEPLETETPKPKWLSFAIFGFLLLGLILAIANGGQLNTKDLGPITVQKKIIQEQATLTADLTPTQTGEFFQATIAKNEKNENPHGGEIKKVSDAEFLIMPINEFNSAADENNYAEVTRDDRFIKVEATRKIGADPFNDTTDIDFFRDAQRYSTNTRTTYAQADFGINSITQQTVLFDLAKAIPFDVNRWDLKVSETITKNTKPVVKKDDDLNNETIVFYIKYGDYLVPVDFSNKPEDQQEQDFVSKFREDYIETASRGFDLKAKDGGKKFLIVPYKAKKQVNGEMQIELLKKPKVLEDAEDLEDWWSHLTRTTLPKYLLDKLRDGNYNSQHLLQAYGIVAKIPLLVMGFTQDFYSNVREGDKFITKKGYVRRMLIMMVVVYLFLQIYQLYVNMTPEQLIQEVNLTLKKQQETNENFSQVAKTSASDTVDFIESGMNYVVRAIISTLAFYGIVSYGPFTFLERVFNLRNLYRGQGKSKADSQQKKSGSQKSGSKPRRSSSGYLSGAQFPSRTDMESAIRATNGDVNAAARMLSTFPM